MKVRDVMSRPARTIRPETSVRDILRQMVDYGVSGFPVVDDDGRLVGFVPERALMARVLESRCAETFDVRQFVDQQRNLCGATARDIMTREPLAIEDSAEVTEAIALMFREEVSRLPVVRRGKVVGYLARTDILKAVLEFEELRAQRAAPPTDEEIRHGALRILHSFLGATALSVNLAVRAGVVELSGTVDDPSTGAELEKTMAALPGVRGVVNQLLAARLLD